MNKPLIECNITGAAYSPNGFSQAVMSKDRTHNPPNRRQWLRPFSHSDWRSSVSLCRCLRREDKIKSRKAEKKKNKACSKHYYEQSSLFSSFCCCSVDSRATAKSGGKKREPRYGVVAFRPCTKPASVCVCMQFLRKWKFTNVSLVAPVANSRKKSCAYFFFFFS